jgi:hypothetical protein
MALVQVWIWIAATLVMSVGVALVHSGHPLGDPLAAVSSIAIFADMLLFGLLVFRGDGARKQA